MSLIHTCNKTIHKIGYFIEKRNYNKEISIKTYFLWEGSHLAKNIINQFVYVNCAFVRMITLINIG